jgi:ATP-dependent Lon protease
VRLSLGGVRDEAEIRGHRTTGVSRPDHPDDEEGRDAESGFLLDEVDKMSMDSAGTLRRPPRGPDPSRTTHPGSLLGRRIRLSHVFICTANVLHTIPQALRDRMEVLQLAGYTEQEKVEIAKRFLAPKSIEGAGLSAANLTFTDDALQTIIQRYTREAGVRSLEREISSICRKVARKVVAEGHALKEEVSGDKVTSYLGVPRFRPSVAEEKNEVGIATGLAWTEVGGEILVTEATLMPGRGKLTLTGKLGDVMQESAQAAMSWVRANSEMLGIPRDFYRRTDVHVHIPEGAIRKTDRRRNHARHRARLGHHAPARRDVARPAKSHCAARCCRSAA